MFKTSESTKNIFPAYVKAWKELDNATKQSVNPHLKNKYADIASVLEAVKPTLSEHGLAIMQPPSIGDNEKTVTVSTILLHESGEWIESVLSMTAVDSKPQTIGATITYARRYSLNGLLCISAEDDDGNAGTGVNGPKDQAKQQPKPQPKPQPADTASGEVNLEDSSSTHAALVALGMEKAAYQKFCKALFGVIPKDIAEFIRPNADLYKKLKTEGPQTVKQFNESPDKFGTRLKEVYAKQGVTPQENQPDDTSLIDLANELAANAGVVDGQTFIAKVKTACGEDVSDHDMLVFLTEFKKDTGALKKLQQFVKSGEGIAGFIASIQ
jgi:hypothetical protein